MSLMQQIEQARQNQQHEVVVITVAELRRMALTSRSETNKRIRATLRLYGKAAFARGLHLNMLDECSDSEFESDCQATRTPTHVTQQQFLFRVTIWSGDINDDRFTVGNTLQLRYVRKVDLWNNIVCATCHRDYV
ncbi:hypothetical protein PR001_g1294 [Phytophthora rubi]|uniref:Uncharacterized protein n=1 Tax=Phytophthora rubi TaxID=129364 RepID=A0A6A3P0V7_9STRA|nr:hypothetical protein PR001_g1294 [Phytophthora rubi]